MGSAGHRRQGTAGRPTDLPEVAGGGAPTRDDHHHGTDGDLARPVAQGSHPSGHSGAEAVWSGTTASAEPTGTPAPATSAPSGTATSTGTPPASGYTLDEVAQHDDASSCWAAVDGQVYDLTDWVGQHPGGPQRILSLCGTDGSAAFHAQHDGQARPEQELAQFLLGPLG